VTSFTPLPASRVPTGRQTWGVAGKPLSGESGMTAVELTVVLAIIGIVAFVAYPTLSTTLQVLRSKGAAEQVAGGIRQARQEAITRGTRHCIAFTGTPAVQYEIRQTTSNGTTDTCTGGTVVQAPARG
jgi:prepilin-type N-terminal cleavage/methylation domain-containing protein